MSESSTQGAIAGVVLAVVLFCTAGAGVWQAAIGHPAAQQRNERLSAEVHFWNAVAGESSTDAPTVENQLASDLANVPANKLASFRGDSNRYGGITDAIGYDPFNGAGLNCVECGPLKSSVLRDVKLAKAGGLATVLAEVKAPVDGQGYTLTPFRVSVFAWVLFLWLIIGHASYVIVGEDRYPPESNVRAWLSAPIIALWRSIGTWRSERGERKEFSSVFPDAAKQLDQADDLIRRLPASSATTQRLVTLRDGVESELKRQARRGSASQDSDVAELMATSLQAMADTLEGKSVAQAEVDAIDQTIERGQQ